MEQTRKLWYQRRYSSVERYVCLRQRDQDSSWRMSQTISGTTELYAVTLICTQTLWTCETCTVMMQQSSLQILNSMGNITKTSGTNTSYSGNQLFIHSETSHVNDCTPRVWTHDAVDPTDVWPRYNLLYSSARTASALWNKLYLTVQALQYSIFTHHSEIQHLHSALECDGLRLHTDLQISLQYSLQ
jgi:hypothetical protein